MKKFVIIAILLPLISFAGTKGDTLVSKQSLSEIQQKIIELEKKVNDGKSALAHADTMISISYRYTNTADSLISRWTPLMAASIALFSLLCAIMGFFGFSNIKQNLNNQLNSELASILKDKEKNIVEIINRHSSEKELLSKSRILVLNKKGTDLNENLMKVLEKHCNNVTKGAENDIVDIKQYIFKNNRYDLVLLDNTNTVNPDEDWNFNSPDLEDVLPTIVESICKKGVAFLYFGSDKNDGKFSKEAKLNNYLHLINFSNSPSTAYSNIINLLNFRKLLKN